MSDTLKHLLIAAFFGIVALVIMMVTTLVPPFWQPIVTFAVFYAVHYYLENQPAIDSLLSPSAPATGPPAPSIPAPTASTTSGS